MIEHTAEKNRVRTCLREPCGEEKKKLAEKCNQRKTHTQYPIGKYRCRPRASNTVKEKTTETNQHPHTFTVGLGERSNIENSNNNKRKKNNTHIVTATIFSYQIF